jgi:seryl-tRNA synthetase
VVASGGLSHILIDEEIDRQTIDGLLHKDKQKLFSLPVEKLIFGTSEIRNWVAVAGAVEHLDMKLVDYVPCYRSMAGTGCAMSFASWN